MNKMICSLFCPHCNIFFLKCNIQLSKTCIVLKNFFNILVCIAYEKSLVVLVGSDREEILSGYFRDSHLGEHGAVRAHRNLS